MGNQQAPTQKKMQCDTKIGVIVGNNIGLRKLNIGLGQQKKRTKALVAQSEVEREGEEAERKQKKNKVEQEKMTRR